MWKRALLPFLEWLVDKTRVSFLEVALALHSDRTPQIPVSGHTHPGPSTPAVEEAYRLCRSIATTHYENFPVGSLLAPRSLRKYIHTIYAFARVADDLADEGNIPADDRIRNLDHYRDQLDHCFAGSAQEPLFVALSDAAHHCSLPKQPFKDLLDAFRMDVTTTGFERYEEVLLYCSKSANPIGRLVLAVFGCSTHETVLLSDHLCTGLQLTNFWQDLATDIRKGRMYLPLEDVERFGYTRKSLQQGVINDAFRGLMKFQVQRTREFFAASSKLPGMVGPRLGLELRLTWNGGMTILRKMEQAGYDVLGGRPVITTADKLRILAASLLRNTK